jgi:hypothetical protein
VKVKTNLPIVDIKLNDIVSDYSIMVMIIRYSEYKLLIGIWKYMPKSAALIDCKIETRLPRAIVPPYNDINQEPNASSSASNPNP